MVERRIERWLLLGEVAIVALHFCPGCSGSGASLSKERVDAGDGRPTAFGVCIAPQPSTLPFGAPCGCARDCANQANCLDELATGLPGGACAQSCNLATDSSCGDGARCTELPPGSGKGLCEQICRSTADCPAKRYCILDPPDRQQGLCAGFCFEQADCVLGQCEPYSHMCAGTASTVKKGLLAPCVSWDECQSGTCQLGRCTTNCLLSQGNPTCPEDGICVPEEGQPDLGFCYPRCLPGNQCADSGLRCVSRADASDRYCGLVPIPACSPGTDPGPMPTTDGLPCECELQCLPGTRCDPESHTGTPHGMCVRACDTNLQDCTPGSTCLPWGTGSSNGLCRPTCSVNADCPPSRLCVASSGVCVDFCQSDDECLGGHCNLYSGSCEATPVEGAGMGERCQSDADCKSSLCLLAEAPTPGFCSGSCDGRKQLCPDGATCVSMSGDNMGLCARTCGSDADCAPVGLVCSGTVGEKAFCWKP